VTADLTAFDLFQQASPGGEILFFTPAQSGAFMR
jgi:hypothetical protein